MERRCGCKNGEATVHGFCIHEHFEASRNWYHEWSKARDALKAAHHELTCCHGLWCIDRAEPDHFQLDTLKVLKEIEKVLDE